MKFRLFFILLILAFNCKATKQASLDSNLSGLLANLFSSFDAKPSLKNISENFIFAKYTDLNSSIANLQTNLSNFPDSCGGDPTKLSNLQSLWKDSYAILKSIEIVQFGASGSYSTIDAWPSNYLTNPPDTIKIEATIAGTETISETSLSQKGDSENGFGAIEYLLFTNQASATNAATICGTLTGRRKTYLVEATKLLYTRVSRITLNWNPNFSGNYTTILQTAGANNEFYKSDKEVLDTLIKQIVTIVDKIKDDKVGYPSGISVESGGVVKANNIESRYANLSILNIRYNLEGLQSFYIGINGPGIADYVRYYNISLDERIKAKIIQTINKSKEITNLKQEILSGSTAKIREFITVLNELKVIFSVELAGNLSSSFSSGLGDGDGD
jgi:predicted lipoprotein